MKHFRILLLVILMSLAPLAAYSIKTVVKRMPHANQTINLMTITSPAFKNMHPIPRRFTRDGNGISPPLIFNNVPASAKSLALIMDDPDAPSGTFVHWVMYDIPAGIKEIKEGSSPKGAITGKNSAGLLGYASPYPPRGKAHRYFFRLYSLNAPIAMKQGATKNEVEVAIKAHIISRTELVGIYKR